MRTGQHLRVTAASLDDDGRGVGEVDGVAVHIADLLPGESAEIAVEHVSPHRAQAFGRIVGGRGQRSVDRAVPSCPAFGRCGGCVLQHLGPVARREAKRLRVERALATVAGCPAIPTPIAAPHELAYRNRAIYVVGARGDELVLGAYAPGSHDLVETLWCKVVEARVDEVARRLRTHLTSSGLWPYREADRTGSLRYVVVRANRRGDVLCALVTTPETPRDALAAVATALADEDDRIAGVVWVRNAATSGAVLSDDHEVLVGTATLSEDVAGVAIDVGIGDFTQVNLEAADRLYADLAERVAADPEHRTAIELYSGVGAIGFALARRGLDVLAVERNPRAVAAGSAAAARSGMSERLRFEVGDAADLGGRLADQPADLVVVNPPRKGLDAATRTALIARRPRAIAYVSCDPSTLARDLAAFVADGYRIDWLQPYDLMPGAPPIETVVVLRAI